MRTATEYKTVVTGLIGVHLPMHRVHLLQLPLALMHSSMNTCTVY